MDLTELATVIADLRSEGSDFAEVEVKRAADGFPQSVAPTISAFANTPGGGTLIFGLDESDNFSSVGVYDPAACKAALASLSRNGIEPAVNPLMWDFEFEGKPIVAAQVDELASSVKPCRVKGTGKAYLRAYDGDYELSQLEEQAFIANRDTPRFDQVVAGDSSKEDLDGTLVESYVENCRATSPALARFDRDEILFRTGVVAGPDRRPTVAGLLALGVYPQQFFPNLVIQASVVPGPNDPPGTRAVDAKRFDGPIPLMLEQALSWVQRNTRTRVRFGYDGHGRDESEYPVEAVRELLSNALIHRDLGPYALGEAITLKIDNRQLILSNPGGLWGLSVDRLGLTGVTSARNGYLVRICQNVRYSRGQRVVEALASGIPTVLRSLQEAGMVPPRFHDQGVRFTVRVPNHTLLAPADLEWLASLNPSAPLSDIQRHALVAMRHGTRWTNKTLRDAFPMDSLEARNTLAGLVDAQVAEAVGERGGRIYQLASNLHEGLRSEQQSIPLEVEESEAQGEPADDSAGVAEDVTPRSRGARRENASRILEFLKSGPSSVSEIRDSTGLSIRQVEYAMELLRSEGKILLLGKRGDRSSRWSLTQVGRAGES
ncbi:MULTISPECIES: ATP-binding protein [Streptomyces rochei group]|uniref:ATP-binding protein n=1 Tax=Streptomyces plicatus TaxID=1922 RepID=A0ABW1Y1B0_STRPL|nr:RNA-binding domain-containing protein [Streptomyces plicatus]GGZ55912.1 transcriptional regulator [Streptomyces plicatus]